MRLCKDELCSIFQCLQFSDILEFRLSCVVFHETSTRTGVWRQYVKGTLATQRKLIKEGKIDEAESVMQDAISSMKSCRVDDYWCKAKMHLAESWVIHCKHWKLEYCPMSLGYRAYAAAKKSLGVGITQSTEDRFWGLILLAWNGARHTMKIAGVRREMFEEFLDASREAQSFTNPMFKALGMFTEGYVNFAIGFSGNSSAFESAFALQKEGFRCWMLSRADLDPDETTIEMMERLARTSLFIAPANALSTYTTALDTARVVLKSPYHPLLISIERSIAACP